jgi:hypothetical protein
MSTRRTIALGLALLIAAAPLVWFDLDPKAGDKLLRMTNPPTYTHIN